MQKEKIDVPIVVFSAYSEEGLDVDFLNNHAADFLSKENLTPDLLIRAIDYALERQLVKNIMLEK